MSARTLQLGQTYPTRDGKGSGRVVCVDRHAALSCVALLNHPDLGPDYVREMLPSGMLTPGVPCNADLIIPERKMRTVWLNVYDVGCECHETQASALKCADANPIALAYPVEVPAE